MPSRVPSIAAVMTAVLGLFMILAGFGSAIPGFVKDRVPEQFIPIWTWLLQSSSENPAADSTILALAHASQWIIACTEWTAGVVLLAATFMPAKRLVLTNIGVGLCIGLMGTFMLMMFAMHDYNLPRWNQFPSVLAWLGVVWIVVSMEAAKR